MAGMSIVARGGLDVLDELRIEERESLEFGLIEIHHEKLVRRREVNFLTCELLIKVRHILAMFLKRKSD